MVEKVDSAAPAGSKGKAPGQLVLVVDDEPSVRDLVCRVLHGEGYRTIEAAHGGEALELLESGSEAVDLVVTDVVMPGMDGRELGRRLAQLKPSLPVLYISGITTSVTTRSTDSDAFSSSSRASPPWPASRVR